MAGGWTVSYKENPYHNLAIDEAHECCINRRLKQITSRPSYFETVQLADFMAYLDVILWGVKNYISRNKSLLPDLGRTFVLQQAKRIYKMTPIATIFDSSIILCNIFVSKPKQLDNLQWKELTNVNTMTKHIHRTKSKT